MYLNIKLLLIFLLKILFFCEPEELSTEQTTCVNDYLLLSKSLKTEIYAEKIGNEWKVERGINKKAFMKISKNFVIEKEKMSKFMREEYANKCFELNKELVEKYNENPLNKAKNFSLKKSIKAKKPIIEKNSFSFKDYLNKLKNNYYLILSEDVQEELEKMSFCMVDKIYEFYKKLNQGKYLLTIFYPSENIENKNDAILDKYKISYENELYIAKLELNPMLFRDISVQKVPIITDIEINEEFKKEIEGKEEEENECSVCLGKLIEPENEENLEEKLIEPKNEVKYKEIQQIPNCKHNFHKECLQPW
uniref:RING-type domain-containing protein n=1 Tax=Meloidogyne floridensis TaxID=298350 RepID=A0A915NWW3_9BILA